MLEPAVLWTPSNDTPRPICSVLTWCDQRLCSFGLYGAMQMMLLLLLLLSSPGAVTLSCNVAELSTGMSGECFGEFTGVILWENCLRGIFGGISVGNVQMRNVWISMQDYKSACSRTPWLTHIHTHTQRERYTHSWPAVLMISAS